MTPNERLTLSRSAYGRGYYDAMKKVDEMAASQRKVSEMERNLNITQAKVYESVPAAEHWTTGGVLAEMRRKGKAMDHSTASGILHSLKDAGLIIEADTGNWQRVPVRAEPPAKTVKLDDVPAVALVPQAVKATTTIKLALPRAADGDTLTNMARLACDVRTCAKEMEALASSLDDLAIEVEERIQRINADSQKLTQLRALLKGIGD